MKYLLRNRIPPTAAQLGEPWRAVQVGDRLVFAGLAPPAIRELAQFDSAGAEILPQDEEVSLGSR